MFKIMSHRCTTCIYRKDSSLDLNKLENEVKDKYGYFKGWRICHYHDEACCRGFWDHHKDEFQIGQIAQRLKLIEFVEKIK